MTNAADVLVDGLIRHGVRTVFAMPGEQLNALFAALYARRDEIEVIHPRHEQGAAYMAYGMARATGRLGVLIVPPGPGLLNALTGMSIGYATSTPMLCITGQIPSADIGQRRGMLHELPDQLGTLRTLCKWAERVSRASDVADVLRAAIVQACGGRPRPVAIEIPPDVLQARAEIDSPTAMPVASPAMPDVATLRRAAQLLREAAHPLIVVGSGAIGAQRSVRTLAGLLQAPVVSNGGGRGVLSARDDFSFTWPGGHRLWKDADVVLAVGTRLAQPRTGWGMDAGLTIVRIDIDADELRDCGAPHVGLLGDATAILLALVEQCAGHRAPSRAVAMAELQSSLRQEFAALTPQYEHVMALRESLPDDGVLVDELTQIGYACRFAFPVYRARSYITSGYQGALGYGFATAIGAKAADRARAVVSVNGDGGFLYAATELATAVQRNLGVVAVVFNDNSFGNLARDQRAAGHAIACELHNPDLVAFARSFGAEAERVPTPEALRVAVLAAQGRSIPTVIEVPVGPMPSPWHFIRLPRVRGASGSAPR